MLVADGQWISLRLRCRARGFRGRRAEYVPADAGDVGFEPDATGGRFALFVASTDGRELGSDFDEVGAVDVGALERSQLVAVSGDALQ